MNIAATPGKEFEPFLHAVIDEDPQGPALTMLSALARRNVDPWDEAASLADLAPADAVVQLIALLRDLPPGIRGLRWPQRSPPRRSGCPMQRRRRRPSRRSLRAQSVRSPRVR